MFNVPNNHLNELRFFLLHMGFLKLALTHTSNLRLKLLYNVCSIFLDETTFFFALPVVAMISKFVKYISSSLVIFHQYLSDLFRRLFGSTDIYSL